MIRNKWLFYQFLSKQSDILQFWQMLIYLAFFSLLCYTCITFFYNVAAVIRLKYCRYTIQSINQSIYTKFKCLNSHSSIKGHACQRVFSYNYVFEDNWQIKEHSYSFFPSKWLPFNSDRSFFSIISISTWKDIEFDLSMFWNIYKCMPFWHAWPLQVTLKNGEPLAQNCYYLNLL